MKELGQRSRRDVRPPTCQAGQECEHSAGLLKPDVWDLGAVARVRATVAGWWRGADR